MTTICEKGRRKRGRVISVPPKLYAVNSLPALTAGPIYRSLCYFCMWLPSPILALAYAGDRRDSAVSGSQGVHDNRPVL